MWQWISKLKPYFRINKSEIVYVNFYKNNNKLFKIVDIDVDKISVSKKESYCTNRLFKYFIGHSVNDEIFIYKAFSLKVIRQYLSRLLIISY